ncbi:hypothetical protein BD626DRAFT_410132 [Schizophyllum amplum]|uniref:K Homology domain-containing protein n=1 Tax=Schizophyllum amplum TaxID=97359 RepID=A0A550C1T8_9AGAR|nr:hypothetical protein BD626DRAFT_410132 [Auriculariopsis ampla]
MSSKRKWDQPADEETASKVAKTDENKTASEAAAAAAAIAAKIAAQFAGGAANGLMGPKDPHDGEFTKDIDINDVRNRYMLTKGTTQQQLHEETGASISTKGVWLPDRSKATDKEPPLYLHITASTEEMLTKAVDKVNELINTDLGPLVEDKKDRVRERRKWPEAKLPVNLEPLRNFNVRAKVVGPQGVFVKYIQQETGTRVQIKGLGSGFVEQETGRESDEPLHIHITGPEQGQIERAQTYAEDLLMVVRQEYAKAQGMLQQQSMGMHHAPYDASYTMGGYVPPQPSGAPPPQPGDQGAPAPGGALDANGQDAFTAYWAAYGYDVNSQQFKEWAASAQQQAANQYYQQPQQAAPAPPSSAPPPAPPSDAPPPPPPPA